MYKLFRYQNTSALCGQTSSKLEIQRLENVLLNPEYHVMLDLNGWQELMTTASMNNFLEELLNHFIP